MTTDKLTDDEKDALINAATGIIVSLLSPADAKHARAIFVAGVKHGMERAAGKLDHAAALYRAGKAYAAAESAEKHAAAIRKAIP